MRSIPITLQSHLEQAATTTCLLLKIVCRDGTVLGFTDHDRDVEYDDGEGLLNYQSRAGYEVSPVSASADQGVDNAEASGLVSVFDLPDDITPTQVNAGKLDFAEFWIWLVNYKDVDPESPYAAKHAELMSGTLDEIRMVDDQLIFPGLASLSQQMQQTFVPETAITCRNTLGDEFCGVDVEALFEAFTVVAVGVENDRTFDINLAKTEGFYSPGLVRWLTGDNATFSDQIEDSTDAGSSPTATEITLSAAARYAVQVGDTGEIRKDCRKRFLEDCIGVYANGLQFNGEPNLPVNDEEMLNLAGGEL